MKNVIAFPLAVLFLAACSESTAPVKESDLSVRAVAMTGCDTGEDCMDFNSSVTTSGGSSFNSSLITEIPAATGDKFLGQFTNESVNLIVTDVVTSAVVSFDLYIIGTWDGNGGHKYGPDTWQVSATCNGGTLGTAKTYSFSNKKTTLQSYPALYGQGENKGLTGSLPGVTLGFGTSDTQRTTNHTVSSYDAVYRFTNVGFGSCTGEVVFTFTSPSNQLQPTYDESWGLDNVVVTRN